MRLLALITALIIPCAARLAEAPSKGKAVGLPNAPILIEVFSDFQCPACKSLHEQTLMPVVRDYVSVGKVYLIYRYFPLPGHAYSRVAASYACAAERLGKYEQVSNALFGNQAAWSANGKVDETACRVLTAAEANKVRALIKDPGVAAEIQQDLELGQKANVRQTPTMMLTHRLKQYPLSGFQNYDLLRRFLDDLLAK
jgi:protein-disulfide isomerase